MVVNNSNSLIQDISDSIVQNWDNPALSDFMGRDYLYKDAAAIFAYQHNLFKEMGIQRGDRIALCSTNSSKWALSFMSILLYGAVPVPILSDFMSEQIENIVNHSESKLLIVSRAINSNLNREHISSLEEIWIFEEILNETVSAIEKSAVAYQSEESLEDLALLSYTSGTTGYSKGVMIPYRALLGNVLFCQAKLAKHIKEKSIVAMLPMAHMFGLMFDFISQFSIGVHIYIITRPLSPAILTKAFSSVRPVLVLTVPLILEKIVRGKVLTQVNKSKAAHWIDTPIVGKIIKRAIRKKVIAAFGGGLYEVIVGGAALNQEVETFLHKIDFPLTVGYGATECAPIISYSEHNRFKPGSCGRAVDRMEISIDSSDPENTPGEILAKGCNVMLGYYKNPEATAEVLVDGWYHTGDMGVMDKKGNVTIRGRKKSMLLGPSGQNIYPEEIEDKLNNLLFVLESLVVQRDNKLVALVSPNYEEIAEYNLKDVNLEAVMNLNLKELNEIIPPYERLSSIELYAEEFEKTPKQSIKRYLYS